MNNSKSCCFTAYAGCQNKLFSGSEQRIKEILLTDITRMIEENSVTHFISGVQPGMDMTAAQTVIELRRKYPFITLECVLAHEELADDWNESIRDKYFSILEHCDYETLMQTKYTPGCERRMKAYMIKYSDYIITNAEDDRSYYIYNCPVLTWTLKK